MRTNLHVKRKSYLLYKCNRMLIMTSLEEKILHVIKSHPEGIKGREIAQLIHENKKIVNYILSECGYKMGVHQVEGYLWKEKVISQLKM